MSQDEPSADPAGAAEAWNSGQVLGEVEVPTSATGQAVLETQPELPHQLSSLQLAIISSVFVYGVATVMYLNDLGSALNPSYGGSIAQYKSIISGETMTFGAGLQLIAALACMAASLMWQYRATSNTIGLSSDPALISPKWAVIWWFVPVMFFYKPLIAVGQLWRISSAGRRWKSVITPRNLMVWWGLFWLTSVVSLIVTAAVVETPTANLSQQSVQSQFVILSATELLVVLVAGLWAHIVSRITSMQESDEFRTMRATIPVDQATIATPAPDVAMPTSPANGRDEVPPSTAASLDSTSILQSIRSDKAAGQVTPEAAGAQSSSAEPDSKKWAMKDWGFAAAGLVGFLVIRSWFMSVDHSPEAALRCVKIKRESTYISDMLHFVNSCSEPLNITQCDKIVAAEILEIFGGEKARWNCNDSYVRPGAIGAVSMEARQDNSWLVTAFTNSRWQLQACFAPQKPVSAGGNKYRCQ